MEQTLVQLQTKLMKDYYKDFSKYARGRKPEHKVAWVTSFTPIEILESLDIDYYYPESYAAVIAASGKEHELLEESERQFLNMDCCSYSCCYEGSITLGKGPRGIPPKPDILIATNNQCNTLPNWWNILSKRYNVPLVVLDYPGEFTDRDTAYKYVFEQHTNFIHTMEDLSGNRIDFDKLEQLIQNSRNSIKEWNKIIEKLPLYEIKPTELFDGISFLITARCKPETAELYALMNDDLSSRPLADKNLLPIFWAGYPLWYHADRYLSEIMDGCRIVGSNYVTWWNIDYSGKEVMECLFQAYNYTFLNLKQETKTQRLVSCIEKSKATGVISLHNKSCKCDFVSAKNVSLPQIELEIDMIDRNYLDIEKAKKQMAILKEMRCTI